MAKNKGDQLRFCCDFRYLNSVTVKDAYPIRRIDENLSKLGDPKFFATLDLGSNFLEGSTEEARQGQNKVCLRAGAVSIEEDAFWSLQRHSYLSTIYGTRIDRRNEEIWQPGDVLRGRLHEEIGTKMQAIKVRDTQGLD